MTTLFLLRHGNTFEKGETPVQIGAMTDVPLTEFGKQQIEEVSLYFLQQKIEFQAIYSGPLIRQKESAGIIAKFFHAAPQTISALSEIDYGLWEGLSSGEIQKRWPKEYAAWVKTGQWPRKVFGSQYEDCQKALHIWLEDLRKKYKKDETVLAITSNGLLQFFKKEKVKTAHFCQVTLSKRSFVIDYWNQSCLGSPQ